MPAGRQITNKLQFQNYNDLIFSILLFVILVIWYCILSVICDLYIVIYPDFFKQDSFDIIFIIIYTYLAKYIWRRID